MRFRVLILTAFALSAGIALLVGTEAGWAQSLENSSAATAKPSSESPTAPTLKVYSRETIVDVTVTDSKGNPVHGLTRSDFVVKEDGKPQPIRSFEELQSQSVSSPPQLPANVYTNLQPTPTSSALNLLLLDGLNTAPPDATMPEQIAKSVAIQTLVKHGAAQYLQTMQPGTRVAVLGLSRSLRILQGVSSDPKLLSAAVDTMETNLDGRASTLAMWCAQKDMQNHMTLEALNQIAASVTSIKGKKNLIWFTAGFPIITDPNVASQTVCDSAALAAAIAAMPRTPVGVIQKIEIPPGHGLPSYSAELRKTYALLAAAQVAVFPIGAAGLGDTPNPTGSGFVPNRADIPQIGFINQSFESMAEATGGAAFYNSNDLAGLVSKAVDKGANYYTLTYSPPGQRYDYAHHTIKVSVDKPGLHLVYRESYDAVDPSTIRPAPGLSLATPPETTGSVDMRATMSRNMPTSQQLLFDVEVDPSTEPAKPTDPPVFGALDAKFKDKPLTRYGFEYALPARQIVFTPDSNATRHAALEFDIAAYNSDGKLVTSLSQSIKLPLTADQAAQLAKGPFRFFQQLDLPPGQLFLRIGILDRTSDKTGTLEIPLTVAKDKGSR